MRVEGVLGSADTQQAEGMSHCTLGLGGCPPVSGEEQGW